MAKKTNGYAYLVHITILQQMNFLQQSYIARVTYFTTLLITKTAAHPLYWS